MADLLELSAFNQARAHGQCGPCTLQGLDAGLLIRADAVHACRLQFRRLGIEFTDGGHFLDELLWVCWFSVEPVTTLMRLQIGFALKNAPHCGLKYA